MFLLSHVSAIATNGRVVVSRASRPRSARFRRKGARERRGGDVGRPSRGTTSFGSECPGKDLPGPNASKNAILLQFKGVALEKGSRINLINLTRFHLFFGSVDVSSNEFDETHFFFVYSGTSIMRIFKLARSCEKLLGHVFARI